MNTLWKRRKNDSKKADMENLRLCMVQMDIAWEDAPANRDLIERMMEGQAGKHDLVVLPEMFSTGFTMDASAVAEPPAGTTENWMQRVATEWDAVVMGSIVVEENGNYYNRLLVVHKGGTALHYDKRHLFRMAGEDEVYTAGVDIQAFTVRGWRVLPLVCYDLRFPVWGRNKMKEDGKLFYDLAVYVANWPERRINHWKALLVARAIENQSYIAGLNRVGVDGKDIAYSGDSGIYDPLGTPIRTAAMQPGLLTATLDWQHISDYRHRFPAWADADLFDVYV